MKRKLIISLLALMITASAASLSSTQVTTVSAESDLTRPSISYKPAPEVEVQTKVVDGQEVEYAAEVQYTNKEYESDADLDLVKKVEVCITSYADCYDEKIEGNFLTADDKVEIRNDMIEAKKEVEKGVELSQLKEELNDVAKKVNSSYDESVYTVTDLFDLSVDMKTLHEIGGPDNFVQITFRAEAYRNYTIDNTVFLHRDAETKTWKMAELHEISNEGWAKVRFDSLCPVAILQIDEVKAAAAVNNNTPCNFVWGMLGILVTYVLSITIMTFTITKKSLVKTIIYTALSAGQLAGTVVVGYFCLMNMNSPLCIVLVSLNIVAFVCGIINLVKKIV